VGSSYIVTGCQAARLDGLCEPDYAAWRTLPLLHDLQQERADVTATVAGSIETAFAGRVETSGDLVGESRHGTEEADLRIPRQFGRLKQPDRASGMHVHVTRPRDVGANAAVEARVMGWTLDGEGASHCGSEARTIREALRCTPRR